LTKNLTFNIIDKKSGGGFMAKCGATKKDTKKATAKTTTKKEKKSK
jgi:hypothetical protein